MRKVIAFRANDLQQKILDNAEMIYQKPACKIILDLVENELRLKLKEAWASGIRPQPFTPPPQRRKRKDASNPC